jgi:hypothetical protein
MPLFLIDSVLHPGTSGSPVITAPTVLNEMPQGFSIGPQQWHFLGVNSGSFGELQLNTVWYAPLIVELVNKSRKDAKK